MFFNSSHDMNSKHVDFAPISIVSWHIDVVIIQFYKFINFVGVFSYFVKKVY